MTFEPSSSSRRARTRAPWRLVLPLVLGLAAAGLLACGGGTDVAPPDPEIAGDGFAAATLDGVDLGETRSATASAGPGSTLPVTTMETVTFTADIVELANAPLTATAVVVTDGTTTFVEEDDYTVDRGTGTLERVATGAIPAGGTVDVTYEYLKTYLHLRVGLVFVEGIFIEATFYNLDPDVAGPVTLTNSQGSAPMGSEQAFNVSVNTNQAQRVDRGLFLPVEACDTSADPTQCPLMNVGVVMSYDLTNQLNPCVSGTVQGTLRDTTGSGSANAPLEVEFMDPVC